MTYRIAGIDVHKRMLAVVVADVAVDGEYQFERRTVGTAPEQLRQLAAWFVASGVDEVVMESTAQYWRPVWETARTALGTAATHQPERRADLRHAPSAQAQSNRGPLGRKKDFPDAERLVRRLVAGELMLSFVPDAEQRLWRTVTRRKYQLTCNRVQLQNRLEALLEEMHVKLSSLVSDLLGPSARRMLEAIAEGATDPVAVAAWPISGSAPRPRRSPMRSARARTCIRSIAGCCSWRSPSCAASRRRSRPSIWKWAGCCGGIRMRCSGSRQCPASASIRRSKSSPKSARRGDVPGAEADGVVGRGVSRGRGKCRRELQPPLAERESTDAPVADPGGQRRGEDQGQHLRTRLPATGARGSVISRRSARLPTGSVG